MFSLLDPVTGVSHIRVHDFARILPHNPRIPRRN